MVENVFGVMAHTWRILLNRIEVQPPFSTKIVLCCCTLHNFIRLEDEIDAPNNINCELNSPPLRETVQAAMEVRQTLTNWFVTEGELPYQYNII